MCTNEHRQIATSPAAGEKMSESPHPDGGATTDRSGLEGDDIARQPSVVVRLPVRIPGDGVAYSLPVGVGCLVQSWVAGAVLVDHTAHWRPARPIGLLVVHLGASEYDGDASALDDHLPREVDVVIAPPTVVHLVVTPYQLPHTPWEGRMHAVEVGPRVDPLAHVVEDLAVAEPVVARLEVVGLGEYPGERPAHTEVLHHVLVRPVLRRDEPPLRRDEIRRRGISGAEELVEVFEEVFVEDDVGVHADDEVVLGLLDAHVAPRGD
mmetsp:Transcript_15142/g.36014  ORF Transcript_15142/g.36014 Transcript_15142/m.36014 type:complete len:265 (-) Transcript_15142:1098-1892(-)